VCLEALWPAVLIFLFFMHTPPPSAAESDVEYADLVRRLEGLAGKNDPPSVLARSQAQKRLAEILVSRRTTDRFQCFVSVTVTAGAHAGPGTLTNLGAGGGYVKTTLQLEKLASVTLEVKQVGRLPVGLVFPSQVRWVKPGHGAGVAFGPLDAKGEEALKRALGELVREQPPQRPL
jgi:hypothetical protein